MKLSVGLACLAGTGFSEMSTADKQTIRGKRAVKPNTPRVPYVSMKEPLK